MKKKIKFDFFFLLLAHFSFKPELSLLHFSHLPFWKHNHRISLPLFKVSSRKTRVPPQGSSEQADGQSSPQVSREMLPIHCLAWTCLSIVKLECTSPAKRFPPKTVNEKKFLSTQSLTFILTENQSGYSMVL